MITVHFLPNDFIEVVMSDDINAEQWQEYQDTIWNLLEEREERGYILANFLHATKFSPDLLSQFGTARHLKHPRLGLIVLLGGSPLVNFALKFTEHNASKSGADIHLRIHKDREAALKVLIDRRELDSAASMVRKQIKKF
jgi:hypothetical protein